MTTEYIGPASKVINYSGYACDVDPDTGTERFTDGRTVFEVPKSRVRSSVPLRREARPMAALAAGGGFAVGLDETDRMEVFDGSYFDDEENSGSKVYVRCHVGAVYPKERQSGAAVHGAF